MPWNVGIDGIGRDIASSDDSRVRVVAGPGTGKTFAIKRKAMRLLEQSVQPERILVVTFTRVIAHDLKRELSALGVAGCEDIRAVTLHGLCYGILQRGSALHAFNRTPRPLLTFKKQSALQFEAAPLLRDLANPAFGDVRSKTRLIEAYEAAWSRLQRELPDVEQSPEDVAFEHDLVQWMIFHNAMLIGEVIPLAYRLLRDNPLIAERSAFDHVIVDEYQDLNRAEQAIIDLLAENATLTIVGDSDQSIYGFRYAHPSGIDDFTVRHPNVVDFEMDECRRCPTDVVLTATNLILHNHPDLQPPLSPMAGNPPGLIRIVQWPNVLEEASGIALYVQSRLNAGAAPASILVLSARRYIGSAIRDACRRLNIEAHSYYHEELIDSVEGRRAFSLLTLLVHPDDRVALRWLLGIGAPNFRSPQYALLRSMCEAEQLSPRDLLDQIVAGVRTQTRLSHLLGRYREVLAALAPLQSLVGEDLMDALFPRGQQWATSFREIEIEGGLTLLTPDQLLDAIREYITQPVVPQSPDFVRIMSLHKSKGLTADFVIVAGVAEGILPRIDAEEPRLTQEQALEEQRRLFYVAITRPRHELIISSPARLSAQEVRTTGAIVRGQRGETIASRFVGELRRGGPALRGSDWALTNFQ